jgi:hypothetical protein
VDDQIRFGRYYAQARLDLARMMVRRQLADLLAEGIGTEEQFAEIYLELARRYPDLSMEAIADLVRRGYQIWRQRQP